MSFVIQCDCGQQMTVEDHHVGQSAMCVNCRRTITIPDSPLVPGQVVPVQSSPTPSPADARTSIGAPVQAPPGAPSGQGFGGGGWMKPHRGGLVLTLGILSLLGCCCCCGGLVFGLPALLMGISDISEMRNGRMDPAGYGMTIAGAICGGLALAATLFGGLGNMFTGFAGRGPWPRSGLRWPL